MSINIPKRIIRKSKKPVNVIALYNNLATIDEIAAKLYFQKHLVEPEYTKIQARIDVEKIILEERKRK